MVPVTSRTIHENGLYGGLGPHPSHVQVARPFLFEQAVQRGLKNHGPDEAREVSSRLVGVQWIENVRRALKLPVRTFMTAVVYYHRFRLAHGEVDYMNVDAAAAALFTACKIEDTLKKSRDVLCAAYNLKVSSSEQLTPDDPIFEDPAKRLVGLERLMLESSGFDFRNRDPQDWVIKFTRLGKLDRDSVGRTAYRICLDMYRTYAPLKQTAITLGLACVELAALLHDVSCQRLLDVIGDEKTAVQKWGTSRSEVMETLLDILELYTHNRNATTVGPQYPMDKFIAVRITLNKESIAENLPRYTEWIETAKTNGHDTSEKNGLESVKPSPASPANPLTAPSTVAQSPAQPDSSVTASPSLTGAGRRSTDRRETGTVRYMLDAERARGERETVESYFKEEWEEYEEVIERPAKPAPVPQKTASTTAKGGSNQNTVAAALGQREHDDDDAPLLRGASDRRAMNGGSNGAKRDSRTAGGASGSASASRTGADTRAESRSGSRRVDDIGASSGAGGHAQHSSSSHSLHPSSSRHQDSHRSSRHNGSGSSYHDDSYHRSSASSSHHNHHHHHNDHRHSSGTTSRPNPTASSSSSARYHDDNKQGPAPPASRSAVSSSGREGAAGGGRGDRDWDGASTHSSSVGPTAGAGSSRKRERDLFEDWDRDVRDRDRDRDRDRERERERERDHHHRDLDGGRNDGREKYERGSRGYERANERSKGYERETEAERRRDATEWDRDRERHRERHREDREHKDWERERVHGKDRSRDADREREEARHGVPSSRDAWERREREKDRDVDRDRDRVRDRDRDREYRR